MQQVTRHWTIRRNHCRVRVEARHPQLGMLPRGTIEHRPHQTGDGVHLRWLVVDFDHAEVGEIAGPYREAEQMLLDATAALDEPLTVDQLADVAGGHYETQGVTR